MAVSLKDLGLSQWVIDTCNALNIFKPTPCQAACIPQTLVGKDVIGSSETGTGKTLSFVLPIVDKLSVDPVGVFAIVLTPTRELAFQIHDQFKGIGASIAIRVCVVVGGLDFIQQVSEMEKRPHIVVATPGRLAEMFIDDCVRRYHLQSIKFLVLDEADRLLEESFAPSLSAILDVLPTNRQTLVYSATMNEKIEQLSKISFRQVFIYRSSFSKYAQVKELEQYYLFVPFQVKSCYLAYLLCQEFPSVSCIVFTSSCQECQHLYLSLKQLGINIGVLHSKMKQRERLKAVQNFKRSSIRILVSTDVASRGLDIPQVDLVINYNIPSTASTYIHRVGRTARSSRTGKAISIVSQFEVDAFLSIETQLDQKLSEYPGKIGIGTLTNVLKAEKKLVLSFLLSIVDLVINYYPSTASTYIHRVGRTARSSRTGKAISIVSQFEVDAFLSIETQLDQKLSEYPGCEEKLVLELLTNVLKAEKKAKLEMEGIRGRSNQEKQRVSPKDNAEFKCLSMERSLNKGIEID
eukprot:jgi/Galph1/3453/GphlegSOOS_G2101.1